MRTFLIIVAAILAALFIWTHVSVGATKPKTIGTLSIHEKVIAKSKTYASTEYGVVFNCFQLILADKGHTLLTVCTPLGHVSKGTRTAPAAAKPHAKKSTSGLAA